MSPYFLLILCVYTPLSQAVPLVDLDWLHEREWTGQGIQVADEGVTIHDDQVGMAARPQRPHALPTEHARSLAGPHRDRLASGHGLAGTEIPATAPAEAMGLGQLNVLEDILRSPVRAASDLESGVEEATKRDQVRQNVFPDAFSEKIALGP